MPVAFAAGRWFRFLPAFCLLVLLAGCAVNRPNPSWQVHTISTPESTETVFYATDRVPAKLTPKCRAGETPTTQPMYGNSDASPGGLLYGEFAVQLPPLMEYGELVTYRPRPECLKTPSDPVFLAGPSQQDRAAFFANFRAAGRGAKHVLLYVHGYDFEFDEAVLWTAELKRFVEYDGPVVVYDWASRGDVLDYDADEKTVERSAPRLEGFLRDLRAELGDVPIDVVAHSIGNRLLLQALQPLAASAASGAPLFRNLVLAAPDVATEDFVPQLTAAAKLAQSTTLYVSSLDRALFASQRVHTRRNQKQKLKKQDYRAGRDLVLAPGVATVDVTAVDASVTRHSYYIDNRAVLNDMYQLLRREAPPDQRFGLMKVATDKGSFWRLRR